MGPVAGGVEHVRLHERVPAVEHAERDARRKSERERIEEPARALLTSEGWQRWIKVRASNGLARARSAIRC